MAETLYQPLHRKQIGDPTTNLDSFICTLESGAVLLDAQTRGKVQVWGGQLVPFCGRSPAVITQKGTNLQNVAQAWAHWGETLDIRTGGNFVDVKRALADDRYVILQGDYDQFSLPTRCQDSFVRDHAIVLSPRATSAGKIWTADSLCAGWKDFPEAELKRYAEKLGRRIWEEMGRQWSGQIFWAVSERMTSLPDTSTEDDTMPYAVAIERWFIDGDPTRLVTTLGAPLVNGQPDFTRRLARVSDKGGANPRLEMFDRKRLTPAADWSVGNAIDLSIVSYSIPADSVSAQRIATIKGKVAANAADVAND